MARRDVQLVIRAKDEASRALASISGLLEQLDVRQTGAAASGRSMAASAVEAARQLAQFEKVNGLVAQAADRAEAAIDRQRASIQRTAADLAGVQQQLANARRAIDSAQTGIVDARLAGGDGNAEIARYEAAQAAARDLEQQEQRLTRSLAQQQGVLGEQETSFRQLAASANTAEAALGSFGDEGQRESLKVAAAAEEAARALRDEAAATEEVARAAKARSFFDSEPQQRAGAARDTLFAEQLREEEAAADSQAAALARLQGRLDPLAEVEKRLARDQAILNEAFEAGAIDAIALEKAMEQLQLEATATRDALGRAGRGERGVRGVFGLKPYELTNLGYQVNDVITQLASGTNFMQVLAQQGGQILQLLPNLSARLIALFTNPVFLAAAATFGGVAVALKQAADEAERLRKVEAILDSAGGAARDAAAELAEVVQQVENLGFTAEESLDLFRRFVTDGLNTDLLQQFAEAAKDTADITGEELPEAADRLATAFTRGYEAIAELDDELQFLTLAEREQIRAMFDSGDASGARTLAFERYRDVQSEIADKSRSAWKSATDGLERSFDKLMNRIGETDFAQGFVAEMDKIIQALEIAITKTEDLSRTQIEFRIQQIEGLAEVRRSAPFSPGGADGLFDREAKELAGLKERLRGLDELAQATGDLRDEESAAARKRNSDALRQIDRENELRDARSAADRVRLEGEKAYQDAIEAGFSQRVAQARREQAIERQRRVERDNAEREADRRRRERERAEAEFAERIANQGRADLLGDARGLIGRSEGNAGDRAVLQELFSFADLSIDPSLVAWCAALVNAILAKNGLPTVDQTTPGSDLRARDFLAYGQAVTKPEPGDIVILKRGNNTAQGHVGFFAGFSDNGNVRVVGGNQGGARQGGGAVTEATFDRRDVLGFRRAPSQADEAERLLDIEQKREEQQRELNDDIDRENAKRRESLAYAKEQFELSGTALIDAERRQAVEEAIAEARRKAAEDDLELSDERLQAIRDTVGAEFDLANARRRAGAVLEETGTLRDNLLVLRDTADLLGDSSAVGELDQAIGDIDNRMREALQTTIDFYAQFDNPAAFAEVVRLSQALRQLDLDQRDRLRARAEAPVAQLQATRNALLEQVTFFRELGQQGTAEQLLEQLRETDAALLQAVDTALEFWRTQSGPEAQAAILQFENLRNQILAAQNEFLITAGQIQDFFAGSFSDAFRTFAQTLVDTGDPLQAFFQSAISFASTFTEKLAEAGLEILALKLAREIGFEGFADGFNSVLGTGNAVQLQAAGATLSAAGGTLATAGGTLTAAGGTLGATAAAWAATAAQIQAAATTLLIANGASAGIGGVFHGGGIAGYASRTRAVSPAWFLAATRYHSGGIAGLRPNEVPAILERGEEILTRDDPRHRFGKGVRSAGEGRGGSISQVLAIGDDEIANAMNSASGDRVVKTIIRRNRETIRTMLNE